MAPRMGRPPKPHEERLTETLHVRVSAAAFDDLQRAAGRRRLTMGELLRAIVGTFREKEVRAEARVS